MMESAGTEKYPKEILNEKIENLGAIVSCYSGIESSGAYLSILSKYNDEGLDILSQILRYPVFNQNELDIEKGIIKESIIRKNDDPDSITQTEFNKIIYGDHPYGRDLQWPVVSKITREDLIGWYNSYYHPNNIMMAVYGDFNKKEMLEKINNYFGNWKKEETAYPEIPKVTNIFHPGIYLYNKDLTQAYIYIGHLGINFDNPDKYAVIVLNQIMGAGGFTSRLFKKVRTENGLAYRVGSSFSAGGRDTGQFFVYCQTKNNSASKAIKLILNEINYLRKNPVFDSEINTAKDSIINSYVFSFENSFSVIQKLMNLEYFNRPSDYYQNYIKNIKKVTKLDVLNAAKKYLHPDELTFVVVGKATDLEKQLSEFGKVTVRQPEGFRE